jgi:hypothetical protein
MYAYKLPGEENIAVARVELLQQKRGGRGGYFNFKRINFLRYGKQLAKKGPSANVFVIYCY